MVILQKHYRKEQNHFLLAILEVTQICRLEKERKLEQEGWVMKILSTFERNDLMKRLYRFYKDVDNTIPDINNRKYGGMILTSRESYFLASCLDENRIIKEPTK